MTYKSCFFASAMALTIYVAGSAAGQMAEPPQSLWGDVTQTPAGLQVGNVEVLAGLLLALTLILAVNGLLSTRHRSLAQMLGQVPSSEAFRLEKDLRRLRGGLLLCVYVVVPLLCVSTIVLAGPRDLLGIEISFLAIALSLSSLALGGRGLLGGFDMRPKAGEARQMRASVANLKGVAAEDRAQRPSHSLS